MGRGNMKKVIIILIALSIITGCTSENIKNNLTENSKTKNVQTEEIIKVEPEVPTKESLEEETSTTNDITIINYINDVEKEVTSLTNDENSTSTKEKLKNTFITLTDFIFYNGTINGITFNELSSSAQEKVLEIYTNIDRKIESYYPNYKETIKTTSQNIYTNVIEKANSIKEKYKEKVGEDSYNNTKEIIEEDLNRLKETINPTVDYVKENSKNIYDSVKEKADNWYQNYKESSE